MKFTIKPYEISDLSEVAELFDQYRQFYDKESNIKLAHQFIEARQKNKESIIFVALDNNNKIGFVQLYPTFSSVQAANVLVLNDLYIDAKYRGRGVGQLLLSRVEKYAEKNGYSTVSLSTAIDNLVAQRLYENNNFKRDEEFYNYYKSIKN